MTRYFRCSREHYPTIAAALDAAYGLPSEKRGTRRALPEITHVPTGADGMLYVQIPASHMAHPLAEAFVSEYAALFQEITQHQYISAVPARPTIPQRREV